MTFIERPDRLVSSLAADAEQQRPEIVESPAGYTVEERVAPADAVKIVARPTNPFEGFGSFS